MNACQHARVLWRLSERFADAVTKVYGANPLPQALETFRRDLANASDAADKAMEDAIEICPHCYGSHDGCSRAKPKCAASRIQFRGITD